MKRLILAVGLTGFVASVAHADNVSDLMGLGMPGALAEKVDAIAGQEQLDNDTYITGSNQAGSAEINLLKVDTSDNTVLNSSASDLLRFQLEDDANRTIQCSAASDTALSCTFGDGGTTATQRLTLSSSTADADDDSSLVMCGGGAYAADGTRGACIFLPGEEAAGGADALYVAGASDTHTFYAGSTETMSIGATGLVTSAAGLTATTGNVTATTGSFIASTSGQTLQLQEATAADKCMGTLTLTAATPVVTATTCAKTASRIFLTRTSIDADTSGDMAVTAISNGVSFSVTSEANDTGTVNWLIINEAP